MSNTKFIIGIDLGTTNSTMAYAPVCLNSDSPEEIQQFAIPQIRAAGALAEADTLPSFLYFPLENEKTELEWAKERSFCVGEFAKERGGEIPDRLIASAKSWLCHDGIDRRAQSLPVDSDGQKMSPVEVTAEFLRHLSEAWNQKNPEAPFIEQTVLVTVPASFDPAARQLVQEAAEMADYPEMILLEEPQAAFYSWLDLKSETWRDELAVGDQVLVVDIGGGTTDFSLIAVNDSGGNLELERLAVGSHLLLGGDNMDLALAHFAKNKLEEQGHNIDDWQLQALVHACRKAKEQLLSSEAPESIDVTIQGRGSSLIGSSLTAELKLDEVQNLIVDGFTPMIEHSEIAADNSRLGLQQLGLPYAKDPRISAQLAKFLQNGLPTAILFNGGTMKAQALQTRLCDLLNSWSQASSKPEVKLLDGANLDFAVSRGAVCYGLARQGKAIRIKSAIPQSYYVGVEDSVPAIPGLPVPLKALCVVPFGMEEGSEVEVNAQEFALLLGEHASFRFFSRSGSVLSDGTKPEVGMMLKNWKSELQELHPIETVLDKTDEDGKTVRIKLKAKVTELGVLELWCVATDGREWKLEFDTRKDSAILQHSSLT